MIKLIPVLSSSLMVTASSVFINIATASGAFSDSVR
jgi:hypothetical protein